jgi:hypothetical protein
MDSLHFISNGEDPIPMGGGRELRKEEMPKVHVML